MLLRLRFGGVSAVFLERARQRKLAQLVADHVFRHEHRLKNLAVMHVERVSNELWRDRRTARPRLDRLLRTGRIQLRDYVQQMAVDKRTFCRSEERRVGKRVDLG